MGFIFGSKPAPPKTPSTNQNSYGVRVNKSTLGDVIPVACGPNRIPMSLLGLWDFLRTAHTTPGTHTGKGIGGGTTPGTTTYSFSTAAQALLCYGPVDHLDSVWNSNGKSSAAPGSVDYVIPGGGGGGYIPPTPGPGPIQGDFGVGHYVDYSQVVDDFGAGGPVTLSGTYLQNMTRGASPAPGVYAFDPSTGKYTFDAADAGKTVNINYTSSFNTYTVSIEMTVPGSATWTVPSPSTYAGWSTVRYVGGNQILGPGPGGLSFSPALGQYGADNYGNFKFNVGDIGAQIVISYQNRDDSGTPALNYELIKGTADQSAPAYLSGHHSDAAIPYAGIANVFFSDLELGSSA